MASGAASNRLSNFNSPRLTTAISSRCASSLKTADDVSCPFTCVYPTLEVATVCLSLTGYGWLVRRIPRTPGRRAGNPEQADGFSGCPGLAVLTGASWQQESSTGKVYPPATHIRHTWN